MLNAGSIAPEFELASVEGTSHSLAALLADGPVVLAFYKVSCPVCQLTMPFLERLRGGALRLVAISQDDNKATAHFMNRFGLTMPTLFDREEDGYAASNAFGITHVPSIFVVEPDGKISLATNGFHKRDLEEIATRSGSMMFRQEDHVPEWKAG